MNHFGPALGKRLTGDLLDYFLEVLGATRFTPTYDSERREDADAVQHRHGFETVIAGLDEAARHTVMAWSRRRNAAVRGIVCAAISKTLGPPEQRYLVQQMERGTDEAIFHLYLALRYSRDEWQGPIPACTAKRVGALVAAVKASKKEPTKWALHLLQCLAERGADWSTTLREAARSDHDPSLRNVLLAIDPGSERSVAQKFLESALRSAPSLATIEREAIDVLAGAGVALDEDLVLKSIARHGPMIFELLDSFWTKPSNTPSRLLIKRIDDWVNILSKIAASDVLETEVSLPVVHAIEYVAESLTDEASRRLLDRVNAPSDPDQNFILARIVWLMPNITTDDLTSQAAHRLVELYCRQGREMWRSPGRIATERFVTQVVLPYAETLEDDAPARAAIESILRDAGRRHGRRYKPPWSWRGRKAPDPQSVQGGSSHGRVVLQ
jgi:hypothetical protein